MLLRSQRHFKSEIYTCWMYICVHTRVYVSFLFFSFATTIIVRTCSACKKRLCQKSRLYNMMYPAAAAGRCYVAVCVFVAFVAALIAAAEVPTGDSTNCASRPRRNLAVCSRAHRKHRTHDRHNSRQKTFWTTAETQSCLESALLSACPPVLPEPCHYNFIRITLHKIILIYVNLGDLRSSCKIVIYIAHIILTAYLLIYSSCYI